MAYHGRASFLGHALMSLALWGAALTGATVGPPLAAATDDVQVGVAHRPFALPPHVPLAGYSRRKGKPSTGLHDSVGVRALVLQDAQTSAALVSCDVLIVDEHVFSAVRHRLMARGLPGHLVLVLAGTHTHSGPGAYGTTFFEKISMGHYDPEVFSQLVDGIVAAVVEAYARRGSARMLSRRVSMPELIKNRVDSRGPVDPDLAICAFYREGARGPAAVLVNFSAHPTTLGAWNTELSADYPGVIAREVEARVPGSICLFFAGSVGDQAPVKTGSGFERAEAIGRPIAGRVVRVLDEATPNPLGALQALQRSLALPPARVRFGLRAALPRWVSRRFVDDDATLSVVRVGTVAFLGVPCDLASGLGARLKAEARARGLEPVIIGFASDYIGYCVSEATYNTGKYEALMAFNGPQAGELIIERLTRMLDDIATHGK